MPPTKLRSSTGQRPTGTSGPPDSGLTRKREQELLAGARRDLWAQEDADRQTWVEAQGDLIPSEIARLRDEWIEKQRDGLGIAAVPIDPESK